MESILIALQESNTQQLVGIVSRNLILALFRRQTLYNGELAWGEEKGNRFLQWHFPLPQWLRHSTSFSALSHLTISKLFKFFCSSLGVSLPRFSSKSLLDDCLERAISMTPIAIIGIGLLTSFLHQYSSHTFETLIYFVVCKYELVCQISSRSLDSFSGVFSLTISFSLLKIQNIHKIPQLRRSV